MQLERQIVDRLVRRRLRKRHAYRLAGLPDMAERSPHCANVTVDDADKGIVRVSVPRSKVLILGGGRTRQYAPLDDPAYEVWSCNDLASICVDSDGLFRADRWFELHPRDPVVEWRRRPDFWEWLATVPVPVYQFGRCDNPLSVEFPIDRVIAAGRDYFACTFAYQIGLAKAEGFTTIALYGADLLTAREATVERATVEWWLGFAEGSGITIELPASGPSIRTGSHPARYGTTNPECDLERETVYRWIEREYQHTIPSFLLGNRPPWTLAEYWRWRRAGS